MFLTPKNIRQCLAWVDMTVWARHAWQGERTHKSTYVPALSFLCVPLLSTTIHYQFLYQDSSLSVWSTLLFFSKLAPFQTKLIIISFQTPTLIPATFNNMKDSFHATLNSPRRNAALGQRRRSTAKDGIAAMPQQAQDAL